MWINKGAKAEFNLSFRLGISARDTPQITDSFRSPKASTGWKYSPRATASRQAFVSKQTSPERRTFSRCFALDLKHERALHALISVDEFASLRAGKNVTVLRTGNLFI
ncbi:MAG: hypothetical protein AAGJ51_01605, partial [Pseudomonadota bacterium]